MAETRTAEREPRTAPRKAGGGDPLHGISEELALRLLKDMLLYRRFEEKAEEAYAIGKIGGFCHLHIGQEGVAAGCIAPLRPDDYAITAYRDHTVAIAKGMSPRGIMAELYGRRDGCSGGKGGSMHMFDAEKRFMGGHGIVGGQVPLGAGMAWAIKYRGGDQISLCMLGDAAVNQGGFHEALNMVAVWKLPMLTVVENNEYGMGTAFKRVSATEIRDRTCAYGIPAHVVDGQDVLATYALFDKLAVDMRAGAGPQFVEVRTYRFKGHSMSDPVAGTYRSREEVEERTTKHDPIGILRDRLFERGALDQAALEGMDKEVRAVVDDAAEFADASPLPDPSQLYTDVYAEINEHGRLFLDNRPEAPRPGSRPGAEG